MKNSQFHLQEKEKIIVELKPKRMYVFQLLIGSFLSFFILFFFLSLFILNVSRNGSSNKLLFLLGAVFIFMVWTFISSIIRYTQERYWITNQRIIFRRGFLGYSITSLPLERIVDVVISRSFIQQILGTPSLHLDTFGSGSVGGGVQNPLGKGTMLAVDNPEDLQRLILELVKKKRKDEKLSM